ncbi:hypothetical protein LZD49_25740 [Dyadobacter sp. CY261]|uniref:hypothetical protein n=1 Tax=Dyadobacter sp. CY261 TaxID=2907203 RepID=UPI001F3DD36A|nr:hypothetical protein [Dyadobacter sp. CY261]MCF0073909.1 hypothetical protein [Dyadobacter sp. CY261]
MIHTDFNWTAPLNLLVMCALLVLLVVQCGFVYTRHRNSGRFGIRLILNGLLWLSMVAWLLDPTFKLAGKSRIGLLAAENVPADVVTRFRDSLGGAEIISTGRIGTSDVDTLVVLGQEFDQKVLAAIQQLPRIPALQWNPYFAPDQMSDLHWKGILGKGELQRIDGRIQSSQQQILQIKYAGRTLDSVMLNKGDNRVRLTFPAFSEGRTTTTLHLNDLAIDTLRYFARPEAKLTVRFLLDNPDFETRNLANWLGRNGHSVSYDATLSKNIQSRLNINRAKEPDLIVTIPANASNAAVKKAVSTGKSALFVQMGGPVGNLFAELRSINQALGAHFQAIKISNEESVALSPVLSALPFRFQMHGYQTHAVHYPLAVENINGKVAVSLLNETFPMQLSGDSIAYASVWNEIFAWTRPARGLTLSADAPVFKNVPAVMHLNNFQQIPRWLEIRSDTAFTKTSVLNAHSAEVTFLPVRDGWQSLNDSLGTELYVQDYSPLKYAAQMQHFVRSAEETGVKTLSGNRADVTRKLPGWVWFAWLMVCLTALWIEPKV